MNMPIEYMLYMDDDKNGGQVSLEEGTVGGAGFKALKQYVQKNQPELQLAIVDEETGAWIPVDME